MSSTRRAAAAVMAVVLAVSALSLGGAALTIDTETTDTTTTSDLTDTSTVTQPLNSSVVQNIEVEGDTSTNNAGITDPETEFTTRFVVNDSDSVQDGTVLFESDKNWTVTTISSAPDYYNATFQNTDFGSELEYDDGQSVVVDARVIYNESESDESVRNATFTIDPNRSRMDTPDGRIEIGADDTLDIASSEPLLGVSALESLPGALGGSDTPSAFVSDSVGVQTSSDDVTIDIDNSSSVSAFDEMTSNVEAGAVATGGYAMVDGQAVPVFAESADVDWLDTNATYATVASDGGSVTIWNIGETVDEKQTVEVAAVGNEEAGLVRMQRMLADAGADRVTQLQTGLGAVNIDGNPFSSLTESMLG